MKNDKDYNNCHSNIRIYRIRNRLTQQELADMSKCTQTTISNLELNLKSPKLSTLINIGKALKICPYKLYDIEGLECSKCKNCNRLQFEMDK